MTKVETERKWNEREQDLVIAVTKNVMEELQEKEDGERRTNNVIMFNVPKSNKDDSKERVHEDTEICSEVIKERLKVEEVEIEQVYRLGRRQEGKMRPLTVTLTRGKGKWEAIKKKQSNRRRKVKIG
ncbi:hypothetical protein SK128_009659 [Halocaridina rubra]|uniref:Uncharacterized protein n=1 Tax=Halocaridina rubra TaxID=373956 RepID=A0AAN9A586_HALRR